ncbi:hypothetical protein J4Q44_G00151390 [Coregonus suidteri]|uniref:Uncharacterized protein n=1 Tax=Coregonus suidteri TaxID=861788 RepID=A0AAN8LKX0_9TELE
MSQKHSLRCVPTPSCHVLWTCCQLCNECTLARHRSENGLPQSWCKLLMRSTVLCKMARNGLHSTKRHDGCDLCVATYKTWWICCSAVLWEPSYHIRSRSLRQYMTRHPSHFKMEDRRDGLSWSCLTKRQVET